MNEAAVRQSLVKALSSLGAFPVENSARTGTPDIAYTKGWIEVKYRHNWPKRATTPIRFAHFKPQQRNWLLNWVKCDGICFVAVRIEKDLFIFDGEYGAKYLGQLTKKEMFENAKRYWTVPVERKELLECLLGKPQTG